MVVLETEPEALLLSVPLRDGDGLDVIGDGVPVTANVSVTLPELVMLGEGDVVPDQVVDPVDS